MIVYQILAKMEAKWSQRKVKLFSELDEEPKEDKTEKTKLEKIIHQHIGGPWAPLFSTAGRYILSIVRRL
jgi:hypothetical protein